MFTGIIESQAILIQRTRLKKGASLTVSTQKNSDRVGDSIALNGVCLTVTNFKKNRLTFDLTQETLNKTTLGSLPLKSKLNMERALKANQALGGHLVQGHVDGVGKVTEMKRIGTGAIIWIKAPRSIMKYIVKKGSITVDGISLTVVDVKSLTFSIALIPLTMKLTNLSHVKKGQHVNLEPDVIGKYVVKVLSKR